MIFLRTGDCPSLELRYKSLSYEWLVVEIDAEIVTPFYKWLHGWPEFFDHV